MRRLEILGIILALAVLVGTPAASFGYESFLRSQNPNEYTIIARAPENGNWSPTTIKVKQGDRVRLRLTSDDVAHGLMIAGYDVEVHEIYPGKFTAVEFVADKAGTFPFLCTVLCSPQHGVMKGELIVEGQASPAPQTQPSQPVKAEKAASEPAKEKAPPEPKATGPSQEVLAAGKTIYQSKCLACHGAEAKGGMGPAIAGITADKVASIVRKPSGAMPPFPPSALSDADLGKLTDYLASLGK